MLLLFLGCLVQSSRECHTEPGGSCWEPDSAPQGQDSPRESPDDSAPDSPTDSRVSVTWTAELVGKDKHYDRIQDAIVDAADGDVVLVQPGTHYERLDFHGKGIHIVSEAGAAATILDGSAEGSVVEMRAMEPETAILEGFTLTNGQGTEAHGGGIFVENADGVIQHNVFVGNTARIGGGVYLRHGSATVRNNLILNNHAEEGGGGLTCTNCKGRVEFNTFVENTARDGALAEWFFEPQGDLIANVVVHEVDDPPEWAIRLMEPKGYTFEVSHNLMWPEVPWVQEDSPWAAEWPGDDAAIYEDPMFVDAAAGDYRLQAGSPAVDSGPAEVLDADGSAADRGAFGGPYGDWSP
jgi:hypothetical protein